MCKAHYIESLGSIAADLFDDKDKYKLFASKVWPLLAARPAPRQAQSASEICTSPEKTDTFPARSAFWVQYSCVSSRLICFHRAIGQIPRFDAATKSQNIIVSGAQTRFPASSSAWLELSPLQ
jgi:hypothetical protein